MSVDATANAQFTTKPSTGSILTVTKSGTGSGTVTSSPTGINCWTTCSATYENGTSVTLTEIPSSGTLFAGWTGACTGMSSTCKIEISGGESASASFTISTSVVHQESSATFAGTWSNSQCSCFSGGAARYTTSAGSSATFKFTGTKVQFVSERASNRGSFKVYLDGVYKTTVKNYSATNQNAVAVWTKGFATRGSHTLKVVSVGTSGHPRVDVDAYVVSP
jgi:hypothetical protein